MEFAGWQKPPETEKAVSGNLLITINRSKKARRNRISQSGSCDHPSLDGCKENIDKQSPLQTISSPRFATAFPDIFPPALKDAAPALVP